ncbi:MAG: GNAT family N-acetyltransferase [Rhodospirillales bacterium]
MDVRYTVEAKLDPREFLDLLRRSGLAARRPVDEPERIRAMVENASLVVAARDGRGLLVGVSRALTDFAFCCYLSDLAVDRALQGWGIGRELIRRTHEAAGGDRVTLLLLSAPAAMGYYPKVGLPRLDNCFGIVRGAGPGVASPPTV